jgi:KUP system potassium uptake protein
MNADPNGVPHSLLNNLVHNRVLHERVVFLTVLSEEVPWVEPSRRVDVHALGQGCYQVSVNYGFKDEVNLPAALEACAPSGLTFERGTMSYFLSRATVVPTPGKGMALWRERLFAVMMHNVGNVAAYLKLPADRVIEVGARIEI